VKPAVLLLSIIVVCYSCALFPERLPPGKRVVRQVIEVGISKDDLYEAVNKWLVEFIDVKRYPPRSFSKGVPSGPSIEYQDRDGGRIVAKAQIWVDYPSGHRCLTDFRLTIHVQQGRYLIVAEDPRYWHAGTIPWGNIRYTDGKRGPRYSFPGFWSTSAVNTEEEFRAFKSAVLEVFGSLEAAVKPQDKGESATYRNQTHLTADILQ